MRDIHPVYQNQVILSEDEWKGILYDLKELDQLRLLCDERDKSDREYLNWSLSPARLVDAMDLAKGMLDAGLDSPIV